MSRIQFTQKHAAQPRNDLLWHAPFKISVANSMLVSLSLNISGHRRCAKQRPGLLGHSGFWQVHEAVYIQIQRQITRTLPLSFQPPPPFLCLPPRHSCGSPVRCLFGNDSMDVSPGKGGQELGRR